MKKYLHIIIPVLSVLLCSLLFLTTADDLIRDIFMRAFPALEENDSVLLIDIDDLAIEKVGIWPWTRDIMADAIVFLREMGGETVVFDLSYLDKSPLKVDPVYVREKLPGYLSIGFSQINETMVQVLDAFAANQIRAGEVEGLKNDLLSFNATVKDSIDTSISYVTRDLDEYFSRTLAFFGKSYLTLSLLTKKDLAGIEGESEQQVAADIPWLESNIALANVTAVRDTKTPEHPGIFPALEILMKNSKGAGFVNAEPDGDGYLRRVHLVFKHKGAYYGQLAFVPLLDRLGNPEIVITNSRITLKRALVNGERKDIRIPRAEDGSVLMYWPKKQYEDFNHISAWIFISNKKLEEEFVENLTIMRDNGFFSLWNEAETPLDHYNNAEYVKELLFQKNSDTGVDFESYAKHRQNFIDTTALFLDAAYEATLMDSIGDDPEVQAYVADFFSTMRRQYAELLKIRETAASYAAGSLSIIGVAATSMTDVGLTAYQERFPNVGLHATVTNMILSETFIDDTPDILSALIALILALALGFGIKQLDTKKSLFTGVAAVFVSVIVLLIFFIVTKKYIGVSVPLGSVTLTFIAISAFNFLTTVREKSFLRSAFSRYLSPAVINEIINDPSKLNLGGEKRNMTAIFTDIRGFSTISEQLDPADLVNLLNHYLTAMSDIILENRGTIDKFEGDAIIAFFGAPIYMDEHATLACKTAIQMKKAETRLNERILAEKLSPTPLFTRIGINSGDMVVGNMGTPNKMDYTVMGNAVNLAARLEGVNKQYNTSGILISEYTRVKIGDAFILRRLDRVRVVGVHTPLRLYELLAEASDATEELKADIALWERAIDLFEGMRFTEALSLFRQTSESHPDDKVVPLYIERCAAFLENPPPSDWDGVSNLTQK